MKAYVRPLSTLSSPAANDNAADEYENKAINGDKLVHNGRFKLDLCTWVPRSGCEDANVDAELGSPRWGLKESFVVIPSSPFQGFATCYARNPGLRPGLT